MASANYFLNYYKNLEIFENQLLIFVQEYNTLQTKLTVEKNNLNDKLSGFLTKLEIEFKNDHEALKNKFELLKAELYRYRFIFEEGNTKFGKLTPEIDSRIKQLEEAVYEHIDLKVTQHSNKHSENKANLLKEFESLINEIKIKLEILEDDYLSKLNNSIISFHENCNREISVTKGTAKIESILGFAQCNFTNSSQFINIGSIEKSINFNNTELKYQYPEIVKFIDNRNLVIIYDQKSQSKSEDITDSTIFRIISSHLPDKLKLHIYDFNGMAKKFSEFLTIPNDVLIKGWNEEEFSEDITSLEKSVRDNLSLIWSNIDTSSQSVHEYNVNRIKNDEYDQVIPFHLYVIDNFQEVLKNHFYTKHIDRIQNLTNYGSNFILMLKNEDIQNDNFQNFLNCVQTNSFHIIDLTGCYINNDYSKDTFLTYNLPNNEKKQIVDSLFVELNNTKLNRNKLRYKDYVTSDISKWFLNKASAELKLPIGRSKNGDDKEFLFFKTKDVLAHALLCGGVGSGKTNFLRTIITSISVLYSPKEVEMYLIDLKNGSGFSVFQQSNLPHAKLFAFSAENELINDIFEKLIIEMESRYTEYAKFNIDNLDDVYKNPSLIESAPKRIVVIIDEFASVFSGEGMYQDEIASNVNILAAKGRAMGINLLLSTQDFSVIRNSNFSKAIAQVATRIVLKSSPEGAMAILGSSNQGYREITNVGEGFINTNYGELNADGGNRFFKSFLLETEEILPILNSVYQKTIAENIKYSDSVFIDSAKSALFESNQRMFNWLSEDKSDFISKRGIFCWLGESYLMNNNEHCFLNWKINGKSYNQNILISGSGNDRDLTLKTIYSIISSLTYTIPNAQFSIKLLNGFDDDFSADLGISILNEKMSNYSFEILDHNYLEELFNRLLLLIEERKLSRDLTPHFIFIAGLEKFIKLHKTDFEPTLLGRQFIDLLSTGNNYGLYFVCEINRPNNLEKIHRDIIGNFEHRIAFYMNPDDSDFMINSRVASKLEKSSNPNIAPQAIYYFQSEQAFTKFKPYIDIIESEIFSRNSGLNQAGKFTLPEMGLENNNSNPNLEEATDDNPWAKFDLSQIGDTWNVDIDEQKNN